MITFPTCSSLKVVPVGMSRGVKKLMQEKFPNMSKFEDISELLMKYGPHKCDFDGHISLSVNLKRFIVSQRGQPFRE